MRLFVKKGVLLLCIASAMWACKNESKPENTPPPVQENVADAEEQEWQKALKEEAAHTPKIPLNERLDELMLNADIAWKSLEEADNREFENIDKLLGKVGKLKKYNKALYDSLKTLRTDAARQRFTQNTLADANQVDQYDATVTTMIGALNRLVETTSDIAKCKDCAEILAEIQKSDQEDLIRRLKYEGYAKEINEIVSKQKTELAGLGDKYKDVKTMPVFTATPQ